MVYKSEFQARKDYIKEGRKEGEREGGRKFFQILKIREFLKHIQNKARNVILKVFKTQYEGMSSLIHVRVCVYVYTSNCRQL